jgi:hypothetical protein
MYLLKRHAVFVCELCGGWTTLRDLVCGCAIKLYLPQLRRLK